MNELFYTLQEWIDLFRERNYTEQALGIGDQPGLIEARLRNAHYNMTIRSTHPHSPKNFTVALPTMPYNDRDQMQLKFNMDFNQQDGSIRIREVIALLNPKDIEGKMVWERQESFYMNSMQDLPDSRTVYEGLIRPQLKNAREVLEQITQLSLCKIRQRL